MNEKRVEPLGRAQGGSPEGKLGNCFDEMVGRAGFEPATT